MASSKRTLDLDILTYQDLYTKAQFTQQFSSYTIPVIPGGSTIYKLFQYYTPEQVLSTADLIFTPSTIPNVLSTITSLSLLQTSLNTSISSLSTLVSIEISSVQSTTNAFFSSATGYTYGSTYSALVAQINIVQGQNIQTLGVQRTIITLGNSISTISSQFIPYFCTLGNTLDTTFDLRQDISSLSSFFTNYYKDISTTVVNYSTNIGNTITINSSNDISTMTGYTIEVQQIAQNAAAGGVSSLSTFITSSMIGFSNTIVGYDPTLGINNISSYLDGAISSLSSYYIIEAGIPGICSLSTTVNQRYISSIQRAQATAGTPGLCTMSTYLKNIYNQVSIAVGVSQAGTVSSFSTALQTQLNFQANAVSTVGYVYLMLQQEAVSISLSTLSTITQKDYLNIASLSTFSTMLPTVYSTINTVFSLRTPFSSIEFLSTLEGSTIKAINEYISTIYPVI